MRSALARAGPCLLVLCFALGASQPAQAEPQRSRIALILVRAMLYDAKLRERSGDEVVMAVVYDPDQTASTRDAVALQAAFATLSGMTVSGLPLRVVALPLVEAEKLASLAQTHEVDAMLVCAGLEAALPTIIEVARARRALTMTTHHELVRAGLAIGVEQVDGERTIQILVNLPASRAEGVFFKSGLLRLAQVIR